MKLIELKSEDVKEFKKLMIEAFQYGYESVYEEDDGMFRFEKNMKLQIII